MSSAGPPGSKRWGAALEVARLAALAAVVVAWRPYGIAAEVVAVLALAGGAAFATWVLLAARAPAPSGAGRRRLPGHRG